MHQPETVSYFGYGSLVASETRPKHTVAYRATLTGWTRQWKHRASTVFGDVCALTVDRHVGSQIDGVVVVDDMDSIAITDEREIGYFRELLEISSIALPREVLGSPVHIYRSKPQFHFWGNEFYPILRSYLDVVLAGFLREFGVDGADRFIRSTQGWGCPVVDDRNDPKYPRSIELAGAEKTTIDELLRSHSIVV